jgi:cysteinyl-tRNA synthetase
MDIIRRILEDYFKYDVLFVQNVTDIDDKVRSFFNEISASIVSYSMDYLRNGSDIQYRLFYEHAKVICSRR